MGARAERGDARRVIDADRIWPAPVGARSAVTPGHVGQEQEHSALGSPFRTARRRRLWVHDPRARHGRRKPRAPGRAGHTFSGRHSHVVQVPGAEEDPALPVPVGVDGVFGDTVIHVERTLGRKMTGEAMR